MKLMIVGHARHGKDTVGEMLREMYGLQFTSSSAFAAQRAVLPYLIRKNLAGETITVELAYQQMKEDQTGFLRQVWYQAICEYCTPDKARLAREIFKDNDCYIGIRQVREFFAAKNEGLFDTSIWVDASERLGREAEGSMRMEPWMCDHWLDNNGGLETTRKNLIQIMNRACSCWLDHRIYDRATAEEIKARLASYGSYPLGMKVSR